MEAGAGAGAGARGAAEAGFAAARERWETLEAESERLKARVEELEARLARTSGTSGRPGAGLAAPGGGGGGLDGCGGAGLPAAAPQGPPGSGPAVQAFRPHVLLESEPGAAAGLAGRVGTGGLRQVRGGGKALFELETSDRHNTVSLRHRGHIRVDCSARARVTFRWQEAPATVLLVKRPQDAESSRALCEVAEFLFEQKIRVLVEPETLKELAEAALMKGLERLETWSQCGDSGTPEEPLYSYLVQAVDLVVTLGGDGTVLWANQLFRKGVPPVVSFSMGSLGFLTNFPRHGMREALSRCLSQEFDVSLRNRLECHLTVRYDEAIGDSAAPVPAGTAFDGDAEARPKVVDGVQALPFNVMNEVVLDRGPSTSVVELDVYVDGLLCTRVLGDGLVVSTPTGSTAYSMSAGGSITHPGLSAILLTPICPHSLSFRPLVLPDSAVIEVAVPISSRSTAWVSFDGRHRRELRHGESVVLRVSEHPFPAVCMNSTTNDWFSSLNQALHWNLRDRMKAMQLSHGPSGAAL